MGLIDYFKIPPEYLAKDNPEVMREILEAKNRRDMTEKAIKLENKKRMKQLKTHNNQLRIENDRLRAKLDKYEE